MSNKILVVGATGNTGTYLVEQLVALGENVRAASRSGRPVAGAEGVRFELTDETTYAAAFEDVDRAFLVIPAGRLNDVGFLETFIRFAAARKVKIVLQTALGVGSVLSSPYYKAEQTLKSAGIPFVILRPNWFSDNFHTFWIQGIRHGVIAIPAEDSKSSFIDIRDIADCAVAALTSSQFDGEGYELTGPEALDYHEAAAILSAAIGKPIRYAAVSDAEFIGILTGAGMPEDYAAHLAELFSTAKAGFTAVVSDAVERLTGKPARSLAVYAADNRDKFVD